MRKKKILMMLALLLMTAVGARAQATYTVTVKEGTEDAARWSAAPNPAGEGQGVTVKYNGTKKVKRVTAAKKAAGHPLSEATSGDIGRVVCAAGHLHYAKTAVPYGCTAVGILGKVTETGHGLILALEDATMQTGYTIYGWTSETNYAGTTLKLLPDDSARGSSLTSYTKLGDINVSNWCVAQKSDYEAIFTNLGSTRGGKDGKTYDANVNAFITTGVGGTAMTHDYWSATDYSGDDDYWGWEFRSDYWGSYPRSRSDYVRPVLAF